MLTEPEEEILKEAEEIHDFSNVLKEESKKSLVIPRPRSRRPSWFGDRSRENSANSANVSSLQGIKPVSIIQIKPNPVQALPSKIPIIQPSRNGNQLRI